MYRYGKVAYRVREWILVLTNNKDVVIFTYEQLFICNKQRGPRQVYDPRAERRLV